MLYLLSQTEACRVNFHPRSTCVAAVHSQTSSLIDETMKSEYFTRAKV